MQVKLGKSEKPYDFENWGVQISVKFRATEEMRVLSKQFSGGERAVSTMLFLMALQGVLPNPFRVVDEINQGMDHNNERRVMQLLVREASKEDMPQYFVITPKLLPQLEYPDQCVISFRCSFCLFFLAFRSFSIPSLVIICSRVRCAGL